MMTFRQQWTRSSVPTSAYYFYVSCFILLAHHISVSSSQTCTHQDVALCTKLFVDSYGGDLDAIFPSHSSQTMNSICSDFVMVEQCITPIKPYCTAQDQEIWEGIENSFDYICSVDGLHTYNKNIECFADPNLQAAGRQCNLTFTSQVKNVQDELRLNLKPVNVLRQDYCKVINQFLECVKEAIASVCNDEAANWQMAVDTQKFKPVFHQFGCTLYNELSPGAIAGIIIGCFIAFILVLAPILYLVNRRRKKQATKHLQSRKKQRLRELTTYSQMQRT